MKRIKIPIQKNTFTENKNNIKVSSTSTSSYLEIDPKFIENEMNENKKFIEDYFQEEETELLAKLKKYIEENKDNVTITGGVTDKQIEKAETQLGFSFSPEMKEYLSVFGSIDCGSVEFNGLGNKVDKPLNIVLQTKEAREKDSKFPANHIVFQSGGDGHLFFTVDDKNNMYKYIVETKISLQKLPIKFENYILSKLKENEKKIEETVIKKDLKILKESLLSEDVRDAFNTLKTYRQKYATPQAKQFFEEIRLIDDKTAEGLNSVLSIFDKYYKDQIKLEENYKQMVLKYSKTVYNQFYEKMTFNLSQLQMTTSESTQSFKRDSFLFSICFMYTGLVANNELELKKMFEKFQNKIESFDNVQKISMISAVVWFFIYMIGMITLNMPIIIGSLVFVLSSCVLIIIENLKYYFNRKNIRKTGDVLK